METELSAHKAGGRHRHGLEALEIDLLLQAIYSHYGYDFREYARASLKRRIVTCMEREGIPTVSGLQEKVLHDPVSMERFLLTLTINVTSLYRDPEFFLMFRNKVVPMLGTYPFLRIWHAGCSSGEEVYSMAILLEEEGLYDRCRIYATDVNDAVLQQAKEGIFSVQTAAQGAANYARAGGKRSLSEYYTSAYGNAIFRASLRDNLLFSQHNLAVDGSFNEFHVILCRNVMIYFAKPLQQRVHNLLYDSLAMFGILGLGNKENIQFTPHERDYEQLHSGYKLYRRIG
jgi:chemotaxis protein methyltransferase CheR